MMIFYKPGTGNTVDPIVVIDYTRSDDQYSEVEILKYVNSVGIEAAKGKVVNIANLKTYSLDYSYQWVHSGITYGGALKTRFTATISNAPMDLVALLNVKMFISQENLQSLEAVASSIIDPEVFFPTGGFVLRPNSNSDKIITRTFIVYSTPFNFDSRRINSSLQIIGSEFDSMVIRLSFAADIKKSLPLVTQLQSILGAQGFILQPDPSLASLMPAVDRYYPPAPINNVMEEICRDNNLVHSIDSDGKTLRLKSLKEDTADSLSLQSPMLTFKNSIPGSNLISTFSLQNYASCTMECEAFDVQLFEAVSVYDDTNTETLFSNLRKGVPLLSYNSYRFYILEYGYTDSRMKTSMMIKGSNNWIISQFKIDKFMESKVYTAAL